MKTRLAIVVSHPVQYYAPLYRKLAARPDVQVKVFFTWHAGTAPVYDTGFRREVAWDIPLTQGYEHALVPNTARDPGTHHFRGLVNPALADEVLAWNPGVAHLTGWAWDSHLRLMWKLRNRVPLVFRGDSHLLDGQGAPWRWQAKRWALRTVYRWPRAFLCTGSANKAYYRAFGVPEQRLHDCPHSIDVGRFAEPDERLALSAREWRQSLGLDPARAVVLFAGKFEPRKRPVEMMREVLDRTPHALLMVGDGELAQEVARLAALYPGRCAVLPFQNQAAMPLVYRMGDVFVLPSLRGETWGLAANEALACGCPVVLSDKVGCAADLADGSCALVFPVDDLSGMIENVDAVVGCAAASGERRRRARAVAWRFDIARTEETLMDCVGRLANA